MQGWACLSSAGHDGRERGLFWQEPDPWRFPPNQGPGMAQGRHLLTGQEKRVLKLRKVAEQQNLLFVFF